MLTNIISFIYEDWISRQLMNNKFSQAQVTRSYIIYICVYIRMPICILLVYNIVSYAMVGRASTVMLVWWRECVFILCVALDERNYSILQFSLWGWVQFCQRSMLRYIRWFIVVFRDSISKLSIKNVQITRIQRNNK